MEFYADVPPTFHQKTFMFQRLVPSSIGLDSTPSVIRFKPQWGPAGQNQGHL